MRPVAARGLVKRYGELVAVDDVDLTVEPGDVYGFLGPNGAGKTTTLRMLLSLIRPDAGDIRLATALRWARTRWSLSTRFDRFDRPCARRLDRTTRV